MEVTAELKVSLKDAKFLEVVLFSLHVFAKH